MSNNMNFEDFMDAARTVTEMGWVGQSHLEALAPGYDITDLVNDGEFAPENIPLIQDALSTLENYGIDVSDARANLATFDLEAWEEA